MAVVTILIFRQFQGIDFGWLFPPILLSNLLIGTFYFFGGLVLLEKKEGTLEAQVVTPLRRWEYLASKVITLTLLSLVESLLVIFLIYGAEFKVIPMVLGISFAAMIYSLLGFIIVARYDSINEYLFPSFLYTLPIFLVFLDYFGLWKSWLFYLHPFQAPLLLMQFAFNPVEGWQVAYGLLYSAFWAGVVFVWSHGVFYRFIIKKEGVRS
ncbi:MAG: ABC transporter permease [bacterium]